VNTLFEIAAAKTQTGYTRRECLTLLRRRPWCLERVSRAPVPAAATGSGKPMRGAFMILSTPTHRFRRVDWEDLARELVFCDRCGVQGVVWPQGRAGVARLTEDERKRGMEVLAKAAQGRKSALVLGVQGKDTAEMLGYARSAEALAPDAMIAMPPSGATSLDEYRAYFRALAKVTSRRHHSDDRRRAEAHAARRSHRGLGARAAESRLRQGRERAARRAHESRARASAAHEGDLGAAFGLNWLYEMRLGLDGVITGNAMYADVMAKLWDLHERRQHEQLRVAFSAFLLMRNLNDHVPGADLYIMQKRGVFNDARPRGLPPGSKHSASRRTRFAEIEYDSEALKPYLSVHSAS